MKKTTHILTAALLGLCALLPLDAQQTLRYKGRTPLPTGTNELISYLCKGGAKLLGTQHGTVFLRDRYAGLPCTIQLSEQEDSPRTLALTFQSRDTWDELTTDYDKAFTLTRRLLGDPQQQAYDVLRTWDGDTQRPDTMELLRRGAINYYASWATEDGGRAQLSITHNEQSGESFLTLIFNIYKP